MSQISFSLSNLSLKPILRSLKYHGLVRSARIRANLGQANPQPKPIAFIIGCGRSGTTLLGNILSSHPQIHYFFEPYHLWAAIEPRSDVLNFFDRLEAQLLMDATDANPQAQQRFDRLLRSTTHPQTQLIVEKTPLNALRIGYLNTLAPNAKFIHLVRDGVEVCHSIHKLARTNCYKIAGKPDFNQWWGDRDAKWQAMVGDGIKAGYYPDDIGDFEDLQHRGAYEWLLSLAEVDRQRGQLGDRLYEITYPELTTQPRQILETLCGFLQLDAPRPWIEKAIAPIEAPQPATLHLSLPPDPCEAFNTYQQRYGFPRRAACYQEMREVRQ
ncbi:MAG: sulfotransferase [Cyanobacteriota bacterium]|nr:sulfotransferase [Cyanobacteriota bacterium]